MAQDDQHPSDVLTSEFLDRLTSTIESRRSAAPDSSYVAGLMHEGLEKILKKVGEESTETVMAALSGDRDHTVRETADLWFHSLVMLSSMGLSYRDVLAELARREGVSGLDEKAARTDGSS